MAMCSKKDNYKNSKMMIPYTLLLCSLWTAALAFSHLQATTAFRRCPAAVKPYQRNSQLLSVVRDENISPWQRTTTILTRPETVKSCALMSLISAPLGTYTKQCPIPK